MQLQKGPGHEATQRVGHEDEPGFVGYWGNGDGRFLYPPNRAGAADRRKYLAGPVSSIRWEMLREGLEDYEYFAILQQEIAKARAAGVKDAFLAEAEKLLEIPETPGDGGGDQHKLVVRLRGVQRFHQLRQQTGVCALLRTYGVEREMRGANPHQLRGRSWHPPCGAQCP